MKVLLVRNYPFDGSTSMRVFADVMQRELSNSGVSVREISPRPVLGHLMPASSGIGKWLGYVDRFILFPAELRRAAAEVDLIHICDHGNAVYTGVVASKPVLVTCHDMLAVRGAMGEVEDCPASRFGKVLQKKIVDGLRGATCVACVSQFTFDDARRILGSKATVRVVVNGLPKSYSVIDSAEIDRRLSAISGVDVPFVMHVGSNLARKNRAGVIRVFAKACEHVDLRLVMAGQPLNQELMQIAESLGVQDRIIQVIHPNNEVLEALYNRAVVLLFPSRYEGFGWPPIEAQACGCPAVASDIEPIAEVLGDSAELFGVDDEIGMARAVVRLATDASYREELRQRGFKNVSTRFRTSRMIDDYLKLYREIACSN